MPECRNVGYNVSETKYTLHPAHQLLYFIPKCHLLLSRHTLLCVPQRARLQSHSHFRKSFPAYEFPPTVSPHSALVNTEIIEPH